MATWAMPAWGADPVRSLDGVDDQVRLAGTAATNVTGAVTMVALVRPDVLGDFDIMALHSSGGSGTGYDFFHSVNGQFGLYNGSTTAYGPPNPLVADEWQLVAVTKAAATATPRFHVYRYSTSTWSHRNASGTTGNGGSTSGGTVRLGAYQNSDYLDGEYAAAGIFSTAMTDLQIETLENSYDNWLTLAPGGMWILNQVSTSHPILDETGGLSSQASGTTAPTILTNLSPIVGDPDSTIFRGDFRTGGLGHWWEEQEVGSTASASIANSSPAPPTGETYYGRYQLGTGDERAEVYSGAQLASGEDVYVRFLSRLSSSFPSSAGTWGQLIWQLHQQGSSASPPVALYIQGSGPGHYELSDTNDVAWWVGPNIDADTWHEFVIRVHHSTNPANGFVELWMDGVQQTLANNQTRKYGATLLDSYNYPKSGYYRDTDVTGTGTVLIAGYRIARSMDDLP